MVQASHCLNRYNHTPRPAVIAVRDRAARVPVRREAEDDLLALDVRCGAG
jgi:diaminopimelate decarboxylase